MSGTGRGSALAQAESVGFRSRDGVDLAAYACGERGAPLVVLVNAVGMPYAMVHPLVSALSRWYRVLSWEARLSPGTSGTPDTTDHAVGNHLCDLEDLLDHVDVGDVAALLGWCSGAAMARRFAYASPGRVGRLVLLSPFLPGLDLPRAPAQVNLSRVLRHVLEKPTLADVYAGVLCSDRNRTFPGDAAVADLARTPFRSGNDLLRYAHAAYALMEDGDPIPLDRPLAMPLLLMAGSRDQVVDLSAVQLLSDCQPSSTVWRNPEGDHYLPYLEAASTADAIRAFVNPAS
jgi:pimeloyl-ACP methyl ester carboxylesterase